MAKPLHAGRAAEAGVLAAQLASRGMRSSLDVLEGDVGLGQAMSTGPDWSQVGASLGQDFHITRLTFKNHVGCGHTFHGHRRRAGAPAPDTASRTHDIERLHLGVYQPTLDIARTSIRRTRDQARFSLHYMVATALVHGSVRLSAYEPARLNDPATRALMQRITKALDPEIDAGFPGRRAARVDDHAARRPPLQSHLQPDRKGDPGAAPVRCRPGGKLLELAAPVIGEPEARALLARIWALATNPSLPM